MANKTGSELSKIQQKYKFAQIWMVILNGVFAKILEKGQMVFLLMDVMSLCEYPFDMRALI